MATGGWGAGKRKGGAVWMAVEFKAGSEAVVAGRKGARARYLKGRRAPLVCSAGRQDLITVACSPGTQSRRESEGRVGPPVQRALERRFAGSRLLATRMWHNMV